MTPAFGRGAGRAAALALALSIAPSALANGRYPAAGQIVLRPDDPDTVLVRATYGLLLSKDHGQRWEWICEGAVGFAGVEDPMVSFTGDGTLLAGIFEGLSTSPDGCTWGFAGGALADRYVVDLSVDKVDPRRGVLVISNSAGPDDAGTPTFIGQLWETADDGATWAQAGVDLPPQFLALTVDTAPSDPSRVYVSGRLGPPGYAGVLQRSDDRGATWTEVAIPGSDDTHLPYIGAIDPHDPDIVYVRIDAEPSDQLLVTRDGGATWTKVFEGAGDLLGFALSPDGAKVAIGGEKDGLWVAPTSTLAFGKASALGARCLTWASAGLYACADEFVDKLTAGLSKDEGKTFEPIMHLSALCGPLACGAGTSVSTTCTEQWPATRSTIGAVSCDGTGGGGASSTGSSGAGGGSGGPGSPGGCGCEVAGGEPASLWGAAALIAMGAGAAGRRNGSRSRSRRHG